MKKQLNEVQRMRQLAGLETFSLLSEDKNLEEYGSGAPKITDKNPIVKGAKSMAAAAPRLAKKIGKKAGEFGKAASYAIHREGEGDTSYPGDEAFDSWFYEEFNFPEEGTESWTEMENAFDEAGFFDVVPGFHWDSGIVVGLSQLDEPTKSKLYSDIKSIDSAINEYGSGAPKITDKNPIVKGAKSMAAKAPALAKKIGKKVGEYGAAAAHALREDEGGDWKQKGIEFLETEIEYSGEPEDIIAELENTLEELQSGNIQSQDQLEDSISDYYEGFVGLDGTDIQENDANFDGSQDDALPSQVEKAYTAELDRILDFLINDGDDHGYGTLSAGQKDTLIGDMISYLEGMQGGSDLNEMAKIKDQLKSAIELVISANPDLEGLALKKVIRADEDVIDALGEQDLYDNQLNKFIALTKGDRTVGARGRKATPQSVAKQDVAAAEPDSKIQITPAASGDDIDNEIGADAPSSKKDVGAANNYKNIILKKVGKLEDMDSSERSSSTDMAALKQFIKKPEVVKTLGAETIKGLVSSLF